jgi:hypothetical protein
MFGWLKFFLGTNISTSKKQTCNQYDTCQNKENGKPIESYFIEEIKKSPFLKKETHNLVLEHLLGKCDILKTSNKLSTDDKKALGINTRQSITKELVSVLNEKGIDEPNPKQVIVDILNRARITKSRFDSYEKSKKIPGIQFKLMSSGGGMGDCEWCVSKQNKILSDEDIMFFLANRCDCEPYSYCYIDPIL